MFLKMKTSKSTRSYLDNLKKLKKELREADAIVIGAGAGLSAAAGHTYSGERFDRYFSDFRDAYGIQDMYSGGFYPFQTLEAYWGWWARHIYINRYAPSQSEVYSDLLRLVNNKDYFVVTTNVDHQFQLAGFDKNRLFYMQGDYGLWQCSQPCHQQTYDNKEPVFSMLVASGFLLEKDGKYEVAESSNWKMEIPTALIPHCPRCGEPMTMNLRIDQRFVQEEGWYEAKERYHEWMEQYEQKRVLYLEVGVGANTPIWIKYPFWNSTKNNPKATYGCLNWGEAYAPKEISKQSICLDGNIADTVSQLLENERAASPSKYKL